MPNWWHLAQDELPPPTGFNETTPITTNPNPWVPPVTDVTITPQGGSMALIMGLIAVFLVFILWWYRKTILEEKELLKVLHFNLHDFLDDTESVDLSDYNRKYGFLILLGIISMFAVPGMAVLVIPSSLMPVRAIIMVLGWFIVALLLWDFVRHLTSKEVRENMNSVWGTTEMHIPGLGSYSRTWRQMEEPKEVVLSLEEHKTFVDKIMDDAIEAEIPIEWKNADGEMVQGADAIDQAKALLLESLQKYKTYRVAIQKHYRVLLIMQHSWNDIKNPNTDEMFNKTTDVTVNRMPMHVVYIGETQRLFRDRDKKGHPIMSGVTMGVFMCVIDRKYVEKKILTGRFATPNSQDAMIARMAHQHEQNTLTVEFVNEKLIELAKKQKEYKELKHKKVVEGQTQFNVYVRGFNRLFEPIGQRGKLTNILLYFLVFGAIWYFIFSIFGWMR